jgi:hypothetical protein
MLRGLAAIKAALEAEGIEFANDADVPAAQVTTAILESDPSNFARCQLIALIQHSIGS